MTIYGKRVSEYLAFQKPFLVLIAIMGVLRLVLSLAGLPDATVRWASMTVVGLAGVVYYGVAVHLKSFGSYRQLLPLVLFQILLANLIAVAGILLAIAGLPNIYAASEYSGPFAANQWLHALGHLTLGMVVPTLMMWAAASLVLWITRQVARRPAAA